MSFGLNEEEFAKLPPEAQRELLDALEELQVVEQQNPLDLYYPHPKQQVFHGFTAPIKVLLGGNQSGKTHSGLADDVIQALPMEAVPERLRRFKTHNPATDGPFLCRIMAGSFQVLEITLYQKLQELLPPSELVGDSWSHAYNRDLRTLSFKNGSRFFFATYEQEVAKLAGATLHRIHYDEEPPEPIRNESRIRVMRHEGQEVFTMTPTEGLTWAYEGLGAEVFESGDRYLLERGDLQAVRVDMDDNPYLSENAKRIALQGLSNEERRARKEGRFVALHGKIYGEFSRDDVWPAIDEIPQHSNVVVGIDPGIRNRAGVVWAYVTGDDEMVVFEEGYFEGYTAAQVAQAIHQTNAAYNLTPIYYVIDPAARNKEHQTGRSDQMEYADNGIVAIAGQHDVRPGINRVKERFQRGALKITANCPHLIRELRNYQWKKPPRTGEDGPEKPIKRNDHLCFVAGTMIATERGNVPIEEVRVGEGVWTRAGLKPVIHSGMTSSDEDVWQCGFDGGRILVGTGKHPVFVSISGWTTLDELRYGDKVGVWDTGDLVASIDARRSYGTECGSIATPIRQTGAQARTSRQRRSGSITQSGSQRTARSHQVITSITSTAIPATTSSSTWSVSRGQSTLARTGPLSGEMNNESGCVRSSSQPLAHGMEAKLVGSGIDAIPRQGSSQFHEFARSVVRDSRLVFPTLATAQLIAEPRLVGTAAVFNLTVAEQPEFFANGVLSHNCDALRYVVMSRPYLPILEETDETPPLERMMKKHRERLSRPASDSKVGVT